MVVASIVISIYCIYLLTDGRGSAPGFVPINHNNYLSFIGFAIYCYEGIGVVMPLCATAKHPDNVPFLVGAALVTLTVIFISFSEMCYYCFGAGVD